MLNEQLQQLGLSEKETKVFLSLLETGSMTVPEIAEFSKINRTTTYAVLNSLIEKNLIKTNFKENINYYLPVHPSQLLEKTSELVDKYSSIEKEIKSIIPNLQSLSKDQQQHPQVLFFEGVMGINQIKRDIYAQKDGTLFRAFCQPKLIDDLYPGIYATMLKKMSGLNFKIKAIEPIANKNLNKRIDENNEIIYIPDKKFTFASDLVIYENKVILISPSNLYGVIIENENIANRIKELFDLAWNNIENRTLS